MIISIAIFVISFLPTHLLPAWSTSNGDVSVTPPSPQSVSLYMTLGSQIKGEVDISGANNDIYFYILDSAGQRVFDAGRVYNSYVLCWEAPKNDHFRFVFDNSMSWITTKHVSWSFSLYYYTTVLWIVSLLLLAISIALLIKNGVLPKLKQSERKDEDQIVQVPVPPEN